MSSHSQVQWELLPGLDQLTTPTAPSLQPCQLCAVACVEFSSSGIELEKQLPTTVWEREPTPGKCGFEGWGDRRVEPGVLESCSRTHVLNSASVKSKGSLWHSSSTPSVWRHFWRECDKHCLTFNLLPAALRIRQSELFVTYVLKWVGHVASLIW